MEIRKKISNISILIASIVLLCMILSVFVCGFNLNKSSKAATITDSGAVFLDEILIKSNGEKVGDKVFNGNNLSKLYERLTGEEDATYNMVKTMALDTTTDTTGIGLKSGKTAQQIKALNNDKLNTIVTIGGKKWIVTSLTVDENDDVIATMWLHDSSIKVQWDTWNNASLTTTYPTSIYGTSYARAQLLNGKGEDGSGNSIKVQYNSNSSTMSDYTAPTGFTYEYSMFTDKDFSGNITEYIVKPKDVKYHETERAILTTAGQITYSALNESTKSHNINWNPNMSSTMIAAQSKAYYFDWANDYIWLPSLCETGGGTGSTGIWGMDNTLRECSNISWLRTGATSTAIHAWVVNANGTVYWDTVSNKNAVSRPAFHLNLTKAEEDSIRFIKCPEQLTSTYDATEQEITDAQDLSTASWYNVDLYGDASKIKVEYLENGTLMQGKTPKDAGTYTVRYTIIDTSHYAWSDNSGASDTIRTANFVIKKKELDFPKWYRDESSKVYNGKNGANFVVATYDKTAIKITYNGTEIPANNTVSAIDVGDYELLVSLKDSKNYKWLPTVTATKLEFEVTQFHIEIKLKDKISGSSDLSMLMGGQKDFSLEVAVGKGVHESITVPIVISTVEEDLPSSPVSDTINLTSTYAVGDVTLKANSLIDATYKLKADTTDKNYVIDIVPNATLQVSDASSGTAVRWQLRADGTPINGRYKDAEIGETSVTLPTNMIPVYDGRTYTFRVTYPDGYELDDNFGYETTKDNANNNAVGKNADKYTTKIQLIDKSTGTKTTYEIKWEITPAKFNLTNVKWKNNGKLEYTGDTVKAELENVPEGLIVKYTTNSGLNVGDGSTARVTFDLTGDYALNYVKPVQGGKDTSYVFEGDGDFEWTKDWEVVEAVLKVGNDSDWDMQSYTDNDGNTFDIPVLVDPMAEEVVDYVYYETDNHGALISGATALTIDQIEYSATQRKYYVALPQINGNLNFTFPDGMAEQDLYSPFFSVGGGASSVSVSIASDKIEYNGKPRNVKVVIKGGAKLSDLTLTYYRGDTVNEDNKLDGAPTERGNYLVVITSNKTSVVLSGKTQYTFEIIATVLQKNWNKNAKPYVLNLKYGQIDGIEYEMQDSNGNTVTYGELQAGNTYKIKAKIKGSMQGNYSFADGTYETDWEEFELRAEDIPSMQDPNDPSNSNYPQEDDTNTDDNPPSGEGTGSGNVDSGNVGGSGTLDEILEKLKELPLWQLIAGVISIILILIFMGKGAGYMSKSKQNKKMAESKYKTYYAGAWLGLAFSGWTAIACVLMGLAVMSLVFMIIAKSKYNKSLIYAETLREEYERNKADIEDRRRQEEYMRRDEEMRRQNEDMQMMFMRMMGGGAGANGGGAQGMPQGGFAFVQQPGIGAEEIRGIVSETVTALLPGMQQALPQQAGISEETVQKMLNKNDEKIQKMIDKNDERIEKLLNKIMELSNNQQQAQPQIIEKEVVKEVPVEKVVEKEVIKEVPVEKIVEVPVEKVVEKEVVKEVKVEVPVAMPTPSKPKKETAPRLTLDEAYALLSKQQQKYFDGLREYALTKDKCKEKKSTYFIVIGQSTVNPLIKLTIKKNMTVALFKMEDEYLKDIKRDATSDGTKVKVKETEVIISDAQACKTAKHMVDLREDQIERYQELLREQRSMKKK